MPHIIVEHSDNLSIEIKPLLSTLHDALAQDPSVEKARIKTRSIPLATCVVGEDDSADEMMHITVKLMPRPDDVREKMAEGLHKLACTAIHTAHPDCVITVETCEIHAHSYCA